MDDARSSRLDVLVTATRLGLTSFGGPIAHIGYFRREYVERRHWLSEAAFADLVALTQMLPGPASSQLGIAIGTIRAGRLGGMLAWLGFTLPSAALLVAFALLTTSGDLGSAGWVHGLQLAAVGVVAAAVLAMWRSLAPDLPRSLIVIAAAALTLALPSPWVQVGVIAAGGLIGRFALRRRAGVVITEAAPTLTIGRRFGVACLVLFLGLLVGLPILRSAVTDHTIALIDAFDRAGSLVFGGGHVVLPLLHETVVEPGWVSDDRFLAGYGAAQAVPGPLFSFAAYLGAVEIPSPNGVIGAALALVAIFVPSFLLIWGSLPFWGAIRRSPGVVQALAGTNAAVVGLLAAALVTPVWTSAVHRPLDAAVAAAAAVAIVARVPPWAVVAACALVAEVLAGAA